MITQNSNERTLKMRPKGIVVDDDLVWQATFARWLGEAGLSVTSASSLPEAENYLDREFFHVAFVDLSLIGDDNIDGLQVLRKIYDDLHEGTAGILLTAYGSAPEGAEAKGIGAFDVFSKKKLDYGLVMEAIQSALRTTATTLDESDVELSLLTGHGDRAERNFQEGRIVETLGCGVRPVEHMATILLRKLLPVLRLASDPAAVVQRGEGTVRATYWSKMLGAPILLLLGARSVVENELARFNEQPRYYEDGNMERLLRFESHGDLAGVVFQTKRPAFEAFERKRKSTG